MLRPLREHEARVPRRPPQGSEFRFLAICPALQTAIPAYRRHCGECRPVSSLRCARDQAPWSGLPPAPPALRFQGRSWDGVLDRSGHNSGASAFTRNCLRATTPAWPLADTGARAHRRPIRPHASPAGRPPRSWFRRGRILGNGSFDARILPVPPTRRLLSSAFGNPGSADGGSATALDLVLSPACPKSTAVRKPGLFGT